MSKRLPNDDDSDAFNSTDAKIERDSKRARTGDDVSPIVPDETSPPLPSHSAGIALTEPTPPADANPSESIASGGAQLSHPGSSAAADPANPTKKKKKQQRQAKWQEGDKGKGDRRGKRMREDRNNVDWTPRQDPDDEGGEKKERLAKRKCAILLGFCGAGYSGMQLFVHYSIARTLHRQRALMLLFLWPISCSLNRMSTIVPTALAAFPLSLHMYLHSQPGWRT